MSTRFVADRSKAKPGAPEAPEALGFYPFPHQLRVDLHRLGATEKLKDFMHFLVDMTAGQRTLFVLLSQRDIRYGPLDKNGQRQPWLAPHLSFSTMVKIIPQAKRLGLVEERDYGKYGTGLALHRHYWALMLSLAPNLAPTWEVRLPGVNTPWPRYDAARDPLIDSCQPAPLAGAGGEMKQHARSTQWSDLPESENTGCSNDWSSEEHRPLQSLERANSGSAPVIRAASDASAEDEPCSALRAQDKSFQDSKATYQDTLSGNQAGDQDDVREENCLLDEEDELEDVLGSYPTSQEVFLKEQIDSAHAALQNPSIVWGARKQAIAEIKMLTPQYKKMRNARLRKAREENSAWRIAYETQLQAAPSHSEVSEPQKRKGRSVNQSEQEGNIALSQEIADAPPMSLEEAEQIVAAYEALGQAVAQAKAEYGKFSQEWLNATQAQRKARPAWWLAQERLAELQREGGASSLSESANVPLLFTGMEQIALVPSRCEAATSPFDLEAHKARVLRQAATFATNPTRAAWPAG